MLKCQNSWKRGDTLLDNMQKYEYEKILFVTFTPTFQLGFLKYTATKMNYVLL